MVCEYCGNPLPEEPDKRFCPSCGKEIRGREELIAARRRQETAGLKTYHSGGRGWIVYYKVSLYLLWAVICIVGTVIGAAIWGGAGAFVCFLLAGGVGFCAVALGMVLIYTAENIANTTENTANIVDILKQALLQGR